MRGVSRLNTKRLLRREGMGGCVSRQFVAPCCHCFKLRLFPHELNQTFMDHLPKGAKCYARYRTKKNIGENSYHILQSFGYNNLFTDDPKRVIYSCDHCYEKYGSGLAEVWEYNPRGFMRS